MDPDTPEVYLAVVSMMVLNNIKRKHCSIPDWDLKTLRNVQGCMNLHLAMFSVAHSEKRGGIF